MSAPAPTTPTPAATSPRNFRVAFCETEEEKQRALALRIAVFVDEQKFSMEDEIDEKDPTSDHFLLIQRNEDGSEEDAGTIRWWPKDDHSGKLGRLCVITKYRGGGSGKILVVALEEHLLRRQGKAGVALKGQTTVLSILHAQMYAQGFYEKAGYSVEGVPFLEDGADHIRMTKTIQLEAEA